MKELRKKIKNSTQKAGLRTVIYKILRNMATYLPPRLYIKFPGYLLNRIFKNKTIIEVNGFRFALDLRHDQGMSRDLYFYRKREPFSTDFLLNSHILKEGDVALDVGANIGYYVLLESKLVGNQGFVYALEPVSSNLKFLKENIALNSLNNIECYHVAAGDKKTISHINVGKSGNLSSLIDAGDFKYREEVEVVTIDDFLRDKRKPALVRMDVEGFEYAIVKGMKKTLLEDSLKGILMEIHPHRMSEENLKEMFDALNAAGFKAATILFDYGPMLVNTKGVIRPFIRFLMKQIGDEIEPMNEIKGMELLHLLSFLLKSKKVVHVYLSKKVYPQ